ncbi:hypothetical protein [Streptomyces sp. NPDC059092]|uniref:hypothetical protein n=1 Tax=Streptomyces sp. NPDC059092 TaxID=3346725 RepID=UPI003694FA43
MAARARPAGRLIFTTITGRVTDPRSLNRMLTILCRNANVRRVRVHDLRHTRASLLLAQEDGYTNDHGDAGAQHDHDGSTPTRTLMDTTLRVASERMDDALNLDDSDDEPEGEGADG